MLKWFKKIRKEFTMYILRKCEELNMYFLRKNDSKYFSNDYFKLGKHHKIYKETIEYYKVWDRERLLMEKIHIESRLSTEQQFYFSFYIVLLMTFITMVFTTYNQFSNNLFNTLLKATSLIPSDDKQRTVDHLINTVNENMSFFAGSLNKFFIVFMVIFLINAFMLFIHLNQKQWYQKNLSVINYLLAKDNTSYNNKTNNN